MYNKLFTKILDSSIWLESTPTRIVWLTFIAVMDEVGFVQFASPANVAHRARVSLEEATQALFCLEQPDPQSSDPDNDGRRVERVPGGWMVLNADKHRDLVTRAVIQEQTRARVKRFRDRKKDLIGSTVTLSNGEALHPVHVTPSEAEEEADTDTDTDTKSAKKKTTSSSGSARSKRPIFTGQRFTVFEWQLDDLRRLLGTHTESFDLHAWFDALDQQAQTTDTVVPQRDHGHWLQEQTMAEAQRRGLLVAAANGNLVTTQTCVGGHSPACARATDCTMRTINEARAAKGQALL